MSDARYRLEQDVDCASKMVGKAADAVDTLRGVVDTSLVNDISSAITDVIDSLIPNARGAIAYIEELEDQLEQAEHTRVERSSSDD